MHHGKISGHAKIQIVITFGLKDIVVLATYNDTRDGGDGGDDDGDDGGDSGGDDGDDDSEGGNNDDDDGSEGAEDL